MQLFKYLSPERIDVLRSLQIRYTQAYAMNDPFESFPAVINRDREWYKRQFKKRVEEEASQIHFKNEVKRKQFFRARNKDFENYYQCYAKDEDWLFEQTQSIIRLDSAIEGYLSLSAVNNNILMWSHYAKNHEGYVLGFNKEHEYFNYGLLKVRYSDERPFLDPTQPKQDARIFYTKSTDWSYEQEYRKSQSFVEHAKLENGNSFLPFPDEPPNINDPILTEIKLFSFPASCVSSVVIGWKASQQLNQEIRELLSKNGLQHVALLTAKPHMRKYEMVIEKCDRI